MTANESMMPKSVKVARSPGKVILSGEHAVVYGAPALVAAADRHTEVWFTPLHESRVLRTAFENLSKGEIYGLDAIGKLRQRLDHRFEQFEKGLLAVQQILQRPDDLAIYTIARLLQAFPVPGADMRGSFPVPGKLHSKSGLPLGAGMGSSAAIIAATLILYEYFLGISMADKSRFEWVRICERLQHGRGSSVDAAAVIYGGVSRVEANTVSSLCQGGSPAALDKGWYWVLSGIPRSSTGECVASVRKSHGKDALLWQDFANCTELLASRIENKASCTELVRENHRLLLQLGVVTASAQQFVLDVETMGGAAKISGAGAVKGDSSGIILVNLDDEQAMKRVMLKWPDWTWQKLNIPLAGAHLFERRIVETQNTVANARGGALDMPARAH